jgi:arylsulfatase A-like enzyme
MDRALEVLRRELADGADGTLLIALADHGGGGTSATHHDSDHPLNTTIPIFLDGAGVCAQRLADGLSILDVSATVLWALGLQVPAQYPGTPIRQAFRDPRAGVPSLSATAA